MGAFAAVETDQLFFDDVQRLWREGLADVPPPVLFTAPEMYQPWRHGRPDFRFGAERPAPLKGPPAAADHGHGIIGGVMLFNATRMQAVGWEALWRGEFAAFAAAQPPGWQPLLNDQDVFNAVFERRPDLCALLACRWNLQYAAHANAVRLCSKDGGNCDALARESMFTCDAQPAIVHFNSQAYRRSAGEFYSGYWGATEKMSMGMVRRALEVAGGAG